MLLQRLGEVGSALGEFGRALAQLGQQSRFLDGNDRLRRAIVDPLNRGLCERLDKLPINLNMPA